MGQEDYLLISEMIFIKIIKFLQSVGIKPETTFIENRYRSISSIMYFL